MSVRVRSVIDYRAKYDELLRRRQSKKDAKKALIFRQGKDRRKNVGVPREKRYCYFCGKPMKWTGQRVQKHHINGRGSSETALVHEVCHVEYHRIEHKEAIGW